jgi:hypothetical protein
MPQNIPGYRFSGERIELKISRYEAIELSTQPGGSPLFKMSLI